MESRCEAKRDVGFDGAPASNAFVHTILTDCLPNAALRAARWGGPQTPGKQNLLPQIPSAHHRADPRHLAHRPMMHVAPATPKPVPRRKEETNARRQPCERRTTTIIKENRTRKIIIRITDSELAAIRANAATAGLTLSRYARQRMLLQPIIPTIPAEVQQLRADVSGLCNNANQIARAVNGKVREPTRAAEEAAQLARRAYQSVEQIRELIARGV